MIISEKKTPFHSGVFCFGIFLFQSLFTTCLYGQKLHREAGVNVYGLSYHMDRKTYDGKSFNEVNPGIGINYKFAETKRNIGFAEMGIFEDSSEKTAKYLAVGFRYKCCREILSAGVSLVFFDGPSANDGHPLLAPIPVAAFRYKAVSFNLSYLPAFQDVNPYASLGLYGTYYFAKW